MAGKLIFDQPGQPNAKITNAGDITIAHEGLAALVAPQVANSGVIRANMGKVILAGAEAHTLDLYGDGMVAINVTKQVTTAPDGGTALVTNTGVIEARGGSVVLTARAVDGVVQTLVEAGGKITANSVAGHNGASGRTGRVVIAGTGGDVTVSGVIDAEGIAPGTKGGVIVANTTGTVAIASSARLSVAGVAGGGTMALGTTYARAAGGPSVTSKKTAKAVLLAAGSTISADATGTGNGGRVTVLSTAQTSTAGLITAKGGRQGGNGGFVEVSGESGFEPGGSIDTSAPKGAVGTILLDPDNLTIVNGQSTTAQVSNGNTVTAGSPPSNAVIAAGTIDGFVGNIVLQGQTSVTVNAPITLNGEASSLTLDAITGNLQVNAPVTASGAQTLAFNAGGNIDLENNLTAGNIALTAGTGISLSNGRVFATQGSVSVTAGAFTLGSGGTVAAVNGATDVLIFSDLNQSANSLVQASRDISVSGQINENGGLVLAARNISAQGLQQSAGTIAAGGAISIGTGQGAAGWGGSSPTSGAFSQSGGAVIASGPINIFSSSSFSQAAGATVATGGTLGVTAASDIALGGTVSASGAASGFMVLSTGGNLTLAGLLGGPMQVSAGNALQAPSGAMQIVPGAVIGVAGAVSDTTVGPLGPPMWQPPTPTSDTQRIPLTLVGSTVDIGSNFTVSTLSLYASGLIMEETGSAINATTLTGSAGAGDSVPAGLTALGWANAAALGWQGTVGSLDFPNSANQIATLSDFSATGYFSFTEGASKLTQIGTLSVAGGALLSLVASSAVPSPQIVQDGGVINGGFVELSAHGGISLADGGVTATSGFISLNGPTSLGAGEVVATIGQGTDIYSDTSLSLAPGTSLTSNRDLIAVNLIQNGGLISAGRDIQLTTLTQNGGQISSGQDIQITTLMQSSGQVTSGRNIQLTTLTQNGGQVSSGQDIQLTTLTQSSGQINSVGNIQLTTLTQNGGQITSAGQFLLGTGTGSAGTAGSTATSGQFVQNAGSIVAGGPVAIFTAGTFSQAPGAILTSANTVGVTTLGDASIAGTVSSSVPGGGSAGGGISINAGGSVGITGALAAGTITLDGASGIALGTIAADVLALEFANGGVVETPTARIAVRLLTGSGLVGGNLSSTELDECDWIGRRRGHGRQHHDQ